MGAIYDIFLSIKGFFPLFSFVILSYLNIICNSGTRSKMDLNCYSSEHHWFWYFNGRVGGETNKNNSSKNWKNKAVINCTPFPHPTYLHKQINHGRASSIWIVKEQTFLSDNITCFLFHSKLNTKRSINLHCLIGFEKGLLQAIGMGIG